VLPNLKNLKEKGFTLIELLIVITIISILSSVMLVSLKNTREKSYFSRAKSEFRSLGTALELYYEDNNAYPPDASRNIPAGLGPYLAGGVPASWPTGPWPNSVYDWENWDDPDHPGQKIYQISIRFCPSGGPLSACVFPDETWAANFDIDSAVYYCISGFCRSHVSQPANYPGYCVNC
jgi:prepilin-type N-terminal cleavage/methylation domain-containing protein